MQPLSPDLQPPLPLQEFCPLQACFSLEKLAAIWPLFAEETELVEDVFCATTVLPAMKPASAAPIISDFIDFVIVILLLKVVWVVVEWLILTLLVLLTCEPSFRISSRRGKSLTAKQSFLEPHLGDDCWPGRRHCSLHRTPCQLAER